MTLGKYLIVALAVFFAGLTVLYFGVNRPPFRQAPSGAPMQHGQVLTDKSAGMLFSQQSELLTGNNR